MRMASKSVGFEGISGISKSFAAVAFSGLLAVQGAQAQEGQQLSAQFVLDNFNHTERVSYIAGVIEGLAFSRYMADGRKTEGMTCIYDWYFRDHSNLDLVVESFQEWPDYNPGAIVGLLVDRACPK